jgi:hypothetical protein
MKKIRRKSRWMGMLNWVFYSACFAKDLLVALSLWKDDPIIEGYLMYNARWRMWSSITTIHTSQPPTVYLSLILSNTCLFAMCYVTKKFQKIATKSSKYSCKVCLLELIGQFLPPVTTSIHTKLEIWQK